MQVTCIMCRVGHKLLAKKTYSVSQQARMALLGDECIVFFCRYCRHEHSVPLVELLKVDGPYYWVESANR